MNKKFWLFTLLFLVAGTLAQAQQPKKVPRIGYLTASTPVAQLPEALREGLRQLGYIEGQNIAIEFLYAEEKPDRLPILAAELVRLRWT
jgi:putative tryptophan/tyrosine transport system substrate-binding protein